MPPITLVSLNPLLPSIYLTVTNAPLSFTFGRNSDVVDFTINHQHISSKMFNIALSKDKVKITNISQKNAIYINDNLLKPNMVGIVESGDYISLVYPYSSEKSVAIYEMKFGINNEASIPDKTISRKWVKESKVNSKRHNIEDHSQFDDLKRAKTLSQLNQRNKEFLKEEDRLIQLIARKRRNVLRVYSEYEHLFIPKDNVSISTNIEKCLTILTNYLEEKTIAYEKEENVLKSQLFSDLLRLRSELDGKAQEAHESKVNDLLS